MEIDRRGHNDAVFYDCDNPDFVEFIESTGYFEENYGTFSDISIIAPKAGISAVNLSAGYNKEHTTNEYVVMRDVDRLCKEVCKLLCINTVQFEYVEAEHPWDKWGKWCNTPYYRLDDDTDDLSEDYNEDTYDTKPMYYVADKRYTVEEYYYAVNRYEAGGRFLSEYTQFHWDDLFIEYLGDDNYSM